MEALLIRLWLGELAGDAIEIVDDAALVLARAMVRERGAATGLDALACEGAATAVSELARNQLRHVGHGWIAARAITRGGVPGLEVIAADDGNGIADPTAAMAGAARAVGSLGVGLAATHRLVDELDVDTRWGEGTCVRARKFTAPVPRSELAVVGRPIPGEPASGDHAVIVRDDTGVLVAVIDGLGHGAEARVAADAAAEAAAGCADLPVDAVLERCDRAVAGTRGAVMSVARLDHATAALRFAGIGNVTGRVVERGAAHGLLATAGTLGAARPRRIAVEARTLAAGQLVALWTDGLTSRAELDRDPALIRQPPLVIAHDLIRRFARATDDALVAVIR